MEKRDTKMTQQQEVMMEKDWTFQSKQKEIEKGQTFQNKQKDKKVSYNPMYSREIGSLTLDKKVIAEEGNYNKIKGNQEKNKEGFGLEDLTPLLSKYYSIQYLNKMRFQGL